MKCANCSRDAMYEYRVTQGSSVFYCGTDLPAFLEPRRRAGLLTITPKLTEELSSALEVLSDKPVVEAAPEEKPAPKKKAAKKKAE